MFYVCSNAPTRRKEIAESSGSLEAIPPAAARSRSVGAQSTKRASKPGRDGHGQDRRPETLYSRPLARKSMISLSSYSVSYWFWLECFGRERRSWFDEGGGVLGLAF